MLNLGAMPTKIWKIQPLTLEQQIKCDVMLSSSDLHDIPCFKTFLD